MSLSEWLLLALVLINFGRFVMDFVKVNHMKGEK